MNFDTAYELYRAYFERALGQLCEEMDFCPALLAESMRYSLLSGGKRIRPVLFLATLDLLGGDYAAETGLAAAIECVHTYSLIHDDLPAMDDDDVRRGRPSNHKMFGEANAILAGDALLSYAFDLALREAGRGSSHLEAARILSRAAGAEGMVAGQSADLACEGKEAGEEALLFIHRNKTARMIEAPLLMAAELADRERETLARFGQSLGMLFQITDDILDVKGVGMGKTLGKDLEEGKLTAVKVYGMAGAEARADEISERCLRLLDELHADPSFLRGVVGLVRNRNL